MLTQEEIDRLLNLIKSLDSNRTIDIPPAGQAISLNASSESTNDKFIIDVNRKGRIAIRCTYQTRYRNSIILLRVDLKGPPHTNPDGSKVQVPHIHIYKSGYADRWAYPLDEHIITNTKNLHDVLVAFLRYNKISNIPNVAEQSTLFNEDD